jgi:hypothetical protein
MIHVRIETEKNSVRVNIFRVTRWKRILLNTAGKASGIAGIAKATSIGRC